MAPALACALLAPALTGCFASPPQIIALQPNRGSIGVPGDTPIVVQFDRPVVRQSVAGRFTVMPRIPRCDLTAAFAAGAGAPCHIAWLSGDTGFVLQHTGAVLQPATQYNFTLSGGFADPEGAVNTVDHSWTIVTGTAPEVRTMTPPTGTVAVPADLPLAVNFSTSMAVAPTRAAISLTPAVPGTRILRNPRDHTRFLVLPGRPLQPGVTYRLAVAATATDEHGEALAAPAQSVFTAGGLSPGEHAVVLAGRHGGGASEVMLADLAIAEQGDPIATEVALAAPVCSVAAGCGAVADGDPLYTYSAAALSADGRWLAAVETDQTARGAAPSLVVVDAAGGAVDALLPDATLPSWSPDGSTLAFAHGTGVELYQPDTRVVTALPSGDALLAPPVWGPRGELLILDVGSASGTEHVDLADSVVDARYAVPGLSGDTTGPVISPDGTQLAVYRTDPGAVGTWIVGLGAANSAPRRIDPNVQPLGWSDPGTILGILTTPGAKPSLVQVGVSGDSQVPITPTPAAAALTSISVSSSGRVFGYLAAGPDGVVQVQVESLQGGSPAPVTAFTSPDLDASAVVLT